MSAKVATPVKKTTTPKAKPTHPTFIVMISEAINKLNEPRTGSSKQAITKFISANYNIDFTDKKQNFQLKKAINSGVETGKIKQTKGTGATGSFKIGDVAKEAEKVAEKLKAKKKKEATKPKIEDKNPIAKKKTSTTHKKVVATKTATPKKTTKANSVAAKATTKKVVKTTKKVPAKSKSPTKKTVVKKAATKKSTA